LASFSVVAAAEIPSQLPAVSRSVVPVNLFDPHGKPGGAGSGVVIAKDRVVTSCLLIQKARNLEVTQRQGVFKALLQYVLPDRDLCQLRVPHLPASAIAPGSGRKVRIGQHAYAVGAGERQVPAQNEVVISSTRPYRGSQYMRLGTSLSAFQRRRVIRRKRAAYRNTFSPVHRRRKFHFCPAGRMAGRTGKSEPCQSRRESERQRGWAGLAQPYDGPGEAA
jgi:hypothetical protein